MDAEDSFSGIMPIEGVANNAKSTVTISVTMALLKPDTLKPIINIMSNRMGITEIKAVISLDLVSTRFIYGRKIKTFFLYLQILTILFSYLPQKRPYYRLISVYLRVGRSSGLQIPML